MSDFEKTTERKAAEYGVEHNFQRQDKVRAFKAGRNSAKESLEIACRALDQSSSHSMYCIVEGRPTAKAGECDACDAIAAVKARGDWPAPEGGERKGE